MGKNSNKWAKGKGQGAGSKGLPQISYLIMHFGKLRDHLIG